MKLIAAVVLLCMTGTVEQQREARVTRLKAEDGWLTLIGLHWLDQGTHTIGSAKDNAIVLASPNASAHLGSVTVKADAVSFTPQNGAAVNLVSDRNGAPTKITDGSVTFYVIDRAGRLGLRVKDAKSPTRTQFKGLTYFAPDNGWRLTATYEAYPTPKKVRIPTLANVEEEQLIPGKVHAKHGDTPIDLEVFDDGDGFMIVFADMTSGKETYGAGRFLYTTKPAKDGSVILDFNLAESPPCAFTSFATCPLPPPGNRIKTRVEAGEKTPASAAH